MAFPRSVGYTFSAALPTTATAVEPAAPAGKQFYGNIMEYGYLAVLSPQADQVTYLSYLGDEADALTLDNSGNVYVAGNALHPLPFAPTSTFSTTTCNSGVEAFTFVMKLSLASPSPAWLAAIGKCLYATSPSHVMVDANSNVWVEAQPPLDLFRPRHLMPCRARIKVS